MLEEFGNLNAADFVPNVTISRIATNDALVLGPSQTVQHFSQQFIQRLPPLHTADSFLSALSMSLI